MFFSNHIPRLSSKKADLRRIILCHAAPIKGNPDPDYVNKLWKERSGILHKCRKHYLELVNDNGVIPCEMMDAENAAGDSEIGIESVFEEYLEIKEGSMISAVDMYNLIRGGLKSHGVKLATFNDWLLRTKKVDIIKDGKVRYYNGIGEK